MKESYFSESPQGAFRGPSRSSLLESAFVVEARKEQSDGNQSAGDKQTLHIHRPAPDAIQESASNLLGLPVDGNPV